SAMNGKRKRRMLAIIPPNVVLAAPRPPPSVAEESSTSLLSRSGDEQRGIVLVRRGAAEPTNYPLEHPERAFRPDREQRDEQRADEQALHLLPGQTVHDVSTEP